MTEMKKTILFMPVLLFLIPLLLRAQEVKIFTGNNYQNLYATLKPGQSITFSPNGCNGSFQVINAAVKVQMINPPYPYPFMFVYSEKNISNLEPGTDQYCGKPLKITCLEKAESVHDLPQPSAWIPVDRNNINYENNPTLEINIGDRALMLKRAFIWENAEDLGCCHGPYGSVGLEIYKSNLLKDYNFNFDAIANDFCGQRDVENFGNSCTVAPCSLNPFSTCCTFLNKYPVISGAGYKLPGPVFNADNRCNDFWAGIDCLWQPSDPKSEWLDGPWGVCYSRIPVFIWSDNTDNEVSLVLREGDDTNCDDFLGGMLINKNDIGKKILFKAWKYGWIELEIVTIKQADLIENVDKSNQYWYANWNGANPEEIHSIPQAPPYDQFVPLSGKTIKEMESTFFENNTIGLIGGKFPSGKLSKPMMYKAATEYQPAVFGILKGVRLFEHDNYTGKLEIFTSDIPDLNASNIRFNDITTSIQLISVDGVRLYRDANYEGDFITITKDTPNLEGIGWNDKVSSIKIIK